MKPYRCWNKDCSLTEEEHERCWAQGVSGHVCNGRLTHQHKPRKGMGGKNPNSKIRAILCMGFHLAIDNGYAYQGRRYKDEYKDGVYRISLRSSGEVLLERREAVHA